MNKSHPARALSKDKTLPQHTLANVFPFLFTFPSMFPVTYVYKTRPRPCYYEIVCSWAMSVVKWMIWGLFLFGGLLVVWLSPIQYRLQPIIQRKSMPGKRIRMSVLLRMDFTVAHNVSACWRLRHL